MYKNKVMPTTATNSKTLLIDVSSAASLLSTRAGVTVGLDSSDVLILNPDAVTVPGSAGRVPEDSAGAVVVTADPLVTVGAAASETIVVVAAAAMPLLLLAPLPW
jgi:hypothetical protein